VLLQPYKAFLLEGELEHGGHILGLLVLEVELGGVGGEPLLRLGFLVGLQYHIAGLRVFSQALRDLLQGHVLVRFAGGVY